VGNRKEHRLRDVGEAFEVVTLQYERAGVEWVTFMGRLRHLENLVTLPDEEKVEANVSEAEFIQALDALKGAIDETITEARRRRV
jgi:hypothetical protein